jgi:hypothetical protein
VNHAPNVRWAGPAALAVTAILGIYMLTPERLAALLRAYGWFRQVVALVFAAGG